MEKITSQAEELTSLNNALESSASYIKLCENRLQEMETGYDAEDVEQCIVETNGDYSECVDRMVATMKSPVELENVTDAWYDEEGNLLYLK